MQFSYDDAICSIAVSWAASSKLGVEVGEECASRVFFVLNRCHFHDFIHLKLQTEFLFERGETMFMWPNDSHVGMSSGKYYW